MKQVFSSSHIRSAPPVVLVIDDQERNLKLLRIILAHHGFEVLAARSAKEAMERLDIITPDVILLDVIMPEMDGFETCQLIKANKVTHDIPVIFLSAAADHQSIIRAFNSGGVDYITKPFNKAELLARIHTQIELSRSRQQQAVHTAEKEHTLELIGKDWRHSMEIIATLASRLENPDVIASEWTTAALGAAIKAHTERMLGSIDEFLCRHTDEDGDVALTSDSLKDIAAAWYVTARRKHIEFSISAPHRAVDIAVDEGSARRIIDAILSNAVHLCSYEGHVFVHIAIRGSSVVLTVDDDGPGFPQDYFQRQFQPYPHKVAVKSNEAKAAFGYGLAVAKRAADHCGATISIANQTDGGARASVIFPMLSKSAARSL